MFVCCQLLCLFIGGCRLLPVLVELQQFSSSPSFVGSVEVVQAIKLSWGGQILSSGAPMILGALQSAQGAVEEPEEEDDEVAHRMPRLRDYFSGKRARHPDA